MSGLWDLRTRELEDRLGYAFKDRSLLERALTHVSFGPAQTSRHESYQRLEFLGDRVLGLSVSAMLFRKFPNAHEGLLARSLGDLVRLETCAEVGEQMGLGPCIRLGKGERKAGLAKKIAVLGDACEAVLGAVYIDGGFSAADLIILRYWEERAPEVIAAGADPKTVLQEWAHTKGLPEPKYQQIERSGPDHAPIFRIVAMVEGLAGCEGKGKSKRAAERAAAEAMLAREGINGALS